MGIIKDLRAKQEAGTITDEEKETLAELEEEAKEPAKEEEAVDKMVESILTKLDAKIGVKKVEEKKEVVSEKTLTKDAVGKMTKEQKIGAFIKALYTSDHQKLQILSEGTAALGGYLVIDEWYQTIIEEMRDDAVIRPRATVIPTKTDTLRLDYLTTRPIAAFRSEKAVKSTSTAEWGEITLTPYSLACIVPLTQELVDDKSVGTETMVTMVTRLISESIAEREDRAFMTGSGTAQPTGIDNYNATIPRTVATPANVLTYGSLVRAFYALGSKYRKSAVWIMNTATLTKVMQIVDSQNRPIFVADPTGNLPGTVLGRPVLEQNDLTQARIWFGDLKGYYIAVRKGLSVKVSDTATVASNSAFEENLVYVRVEERIDGEIGDQNAFVCLTGTN